MESLHAEQGDDWSAVIEPLAAVRKLDSALLVTIDNSAELVRWIVGNALITTLHLTSKHLQQLREQGLNNQELILALFLSRVGGSDPLQVYLRVMSGENWGKQLYDLGLFDCKSIERKWVELLSV